jgi:hypothetical protein
MYSFGVGTPTLPQSIFGCPSNLTRREAANDIAMLISLLPAERRAMLGTAELADVAMLCTGRVPVGVAKAVRAICDRLSEAFAPLPKAASRR